ncbi:MAG: GNAT family N-acetyltransferase [Pseudomonadota bacterium]
MNGTVQQVAKSGTDVASSGTVEMVPLESWAKVRADWSRLHANCGRPTFFLSTLWVDAWISCFSKQVAAELLVWRTNDCILGVAILANARVKRNLVTFQEINLNTSGERPYSPMLEHNLLLCTPEHEAGFAQVIADALEQRTWDELKFSGLQVDCFNLLSERMGDAVEASRRSSPFVDLQEIASQEKEFLQSLSSNSRQKIRRSTRLYEEQGKLDFDIADDQTQAHAYFDEMVELHQSSWVAKGKPGAFAGPSIREFHKYIISNGVANRDYQLIRFSVDGQTIGVIYNLVFAKHISYYQSGFVYQADNRIKPGLVCHSLAIQDALDKGFEEYDFLATAGEESQYKRSLSNTERDLVWITAQRSSFKRTSADLIQKFRKLLRSDR